MVRLFSEKPSRWLLPLVAILLILQLLTLPLVLGFTYAGRSEAPDHILTYTENKLTWNSATNIGEDGEARLHLFDAQYPGVQSADDALVMAPGTEGFHIVRLKNDVSGPVTYTAILYKIAENEQLPVQPALEGTGFADTSTYPLPAGVTEENVIRAVSGSVNGGTIVDFDIRWLWDYEIDEAQDAIDTLLGNEEEADRVTVGLYIVVEDGNDYVIPQTGDDSHIAVYAILMLLSLLVLAVLLFGHRRERKAL
jgi:hypothetical protein